MKKEEFEVDYDEVIRALDGEMDDLKERYTRMGAYRRVLDAARDACARDAKLNDELERQQSEIDDLNEQLEQKDAEIANLRQQLLEVKEQKLASETKLSELSKLSAGVVVNVTGNYNDVHDNNNVDMNETKE